MQKTDRIQMESNRFTWELRYGTTADVDPAIEQLSDDLDEKEREKRRRKLHLYASETDRDVILAVNKDRILGYLTIVDYDEPRPDIPEEISERLRTLAFPSQLQVHPEFRKRGIGSSLMLQAERWARERGKPGLWSITHRKSYWYKRDFGYKELGKVWEKETYKTVIVKEFEDPVSKQFSDPEPERN
jgi:GNAT superfamily N-acetyltransferase